jgi:hypothetical protein
MSYYFYLSSDQSKTTHINNSNMDFTVNLQEPIILNNPFNWEVALVEIDAPFYTLDSTTQSNYYILSDLVGSSNVAESKYPILRKRTLSNTTAATGSTVGNILKPNGKLDRKVQITSTEVATGEREVTEFTYPLYKSVRKANIESIRIFIRSLELSELM